MAEHDSKGEYGPVPKKVPIVENNNGYPNNVANTQTQKTRGTGAATKGNKHSTKMG
jgi:hypothetical protein